MPDDRTDRAAMEREMAKLAPDGDVHPWSQIAFEVGWVAHAKHEGQLREALAELMVAAERLVRQTPEAGNVKDGPLFETRDAIHKARAALSPEPEGYEPSDAAPMVRVFIDGESYKVRPDVAGRFLLSLRPHRPVEDWRVWREAHPEDVDAGWDRPLDLKGGERFYTTPKYISASSPEPEGESDAA